MPLDAVFLTALTHELSGHVTGAKIDKVQQPERDKLVLSLRGRNENIKLLISAGTGSARLHLTRESIENPAAPPMFCMLLRKHLVGARIVSMTQPDYERAVVFELDTTDELGVQSRKKLVAELMGRSSNVILVGAYGRVIDSLRRVDADASSRRPVLPGLVWREAPQQDRPCFFTADRAALWARADPEKQTDRWLLDTFSALSPLIAREIVWRAYRDSSIRVGAIPDGERLNLVCAMDALCRSVEQGEFTPFLLTEAGAPRDFSFMPIKQYSGVMDGEVCPGFSELLDTFYMKRDKAERMKHRAQTLTKLVKTARDRLARKLAAQREELLATGGREEKRRCGDLITANIYRMKRGDSRLECADFYDPEQRAVTIDLDMRKTPQQNAAAFYKEYNKAKAAEQHLTGLIAKGEGELDYLNSVLAELGMAETERELAEIRRELLETGYVREQRGAKKERPVKNEPLRFVSSSGTDILVGRSNAQNDQLTLKTAGRTDVWLHTQKIHGSHVIVRCAGSDPDAATLAEAASLAAYYSQARGGGKVPVDFTQARFVKKPRGAMPGMVIYTDYSTLMADPADGERLASSPRR